MPGARRLRQRPPSAPRVTAVAGENVSNRKFAQDDAACRAHARGVTDREAVQGELGLQRHYNSIYSDCMMEKGYHIEAPPHPHYYYGPGPYWGPGPFYGPGPYWGPGFYYGGGWGYGRRW